MKDYARLKPFTNNPTAWDAFVEFQEAELEFYRGALEKSDTMDSVKFLQGRIEQIRSSLKLREWSNAEKEKRR